MTDFTKLSTDRVSSETSRLRGDWELQDIDRKANEIRANSLVKNVSSTIGGTVGATTSGFVGLTSTVKPLGDKIDPGICSITASVPDVEVFKSPANKSNIDTLAGRSTDNKILLDMLHGSGSPKGIDKSLEGYGVSISKRKSAVNQSVEVSDNPVLQRLLTKIGQEGRSSELDGKANDIVNKKEAEIISQEIKEFSSSQNRNLGNPIGSSSSPFGAKGVNKANIMGSVAGITAGQGSYKGNTLELYQNGKDTSTNEFALPIVDNLGNTNLSKVVDKGSKTALNEITSPIYKLGQGKIPTNKSSFTYEKVNDKREFEIELKSITRTMKNLIVDWTLSATDEFMTAKDFNETIIDLYYENKNKTNDPITKACHSTHYYIRKDGIVERVLPLGIKPIAIFAGLSEEFDKIYEESIRITFDAGLYSTSDRPFSWENISSKSITHEQWKTFDLMLEVFYRFSPGGLYTGTDELFNGFQFPSMPGIYNQDSKISGCDFDFDTYLLKNREI